MSNDPVFIDDGYSRKGYIAAVPGLHGAMRFTFRPIMAQARARLLAETRKEEDDGRLEQIAAAATARYISEWSVTRGTNPVPITGENILRLHPALWNRLYSIVLSRAASDIDPLWDEGEDGGRDRSPDQIAADALGEGPGRGDDDLGN